MTQTQMPAPKAACDAAFTALDSRFIPSLNVCLERYQHRVTGADHFHIAADSDENVFMVALKTMPQDNTGVAHILEHTALCGSAKYPVRDPFFMMTRRSLNTFMNAFTSSDWTAYPFATENATDYENLLSVYLDAVFFSRLDELDFLQEGHRLEFDEMTNPESPLRYKGVVFNEMKGAMSAANTQLYQALKWHLFPSNTYHYNSGGDPEYIPDLTYAELKAFYKTHYHPSNATFFSFGNRPAADLQARLQRDALHAFECLPHRLSVPKEKRFSRVLRIEDCYPNEGEQKNKTYLSMAWLLGESADLASQLEAALLSDVLLGNSASPLRQALETSDIGANPSAICGLDDSQREMTFFCGLEGSEPERAADFEQLVLGTLRDVAQHGVSQQQIDAALHQLELSRREITGDGMPYGLKLIFNIAAAATHDADVMSALDLDAALQHLGEKCRQPGYISELTNRLLLQNVHRVQLTMRPDGQMKERKEHNEAERLAAIEARLTVEQKERIVEQSLALKARQEQPDDGDLLPKVSLADVKPELKRYTPLADGPVIQYAAGTNGLCYQQWFWPIPKLSVEEQQIFPLYASLLTELGAGELGYLDAQRRQAAEIGNLSLYSVYQPDIDDSQQLTGYLVLSGNALARNASQLSALMRDHWLHARFDEQTRILDHLSLINARQLQGVTRGGHALAMQAAEASHGIGPNLAYAATGLPATLRLREDLRTWQADADKQGEWVARIAKLHQRMQQQPAHALLIGEDNSLTTLAASLSQHGIEFSNTSAAPAQNFEYRVDKRLVWSTDTQVNFCAAAYPTVSANHPDSAALTVLAGVLRNNFLHTHIREQGGAYGGGAQHDGSNGVFAFYSYRDPRLQETLDDFAASLAWLRQGDFSAEQVEQAILGVVSSIDKPGSPAGAVKRAYHNRLFGRSDAFREGYRQRILAVDKAQLIAAAEKYFAPDAKSEAVITDAKSAAALSDAGFAWHPLQ